MNGLTEILYYHSGDLNPRPAAACAARNYGPQFYDHKKATRKNRQRDIEIKIHTDRHRNRNRDGPHWGPSDPSLGDKCIPMLDPYTGN